MDRNAVHQVSEQTSDNKENRRIGSNNNRANQLEQLGQAITNQELAILLGVIIFFIIGYMSCHIVSIPYGSIKHAQTIYIIFVIVNILAALIALKSWNNIPSTSLSRDMALLFTLSLCGAATGNTIDTILWVSHYCHFKQNIATNMIFVASMLLVLPSLHMFSRLCRVEVKKGFLLYFLFFTTLLSAIPFVINPKLIIKVTGTYNYKEFLFGMIYALVGGYLSSFSAYIWNKSQGKLRDSARFMSIGLGSMSIGCAIYAGLFSKTIPNQIPSHPVHIIIAISYIILSFSVSRVALVLDSTRNIDATCNKPELPLTELWGQKDGSELYKKMEIQIKNAHQKLLQAQADTKAKLNVIATLEHEIERRIEAEKNMLIEKNKAELANKTKSEFLAMMSHELKTPLTAIKGYSQLISDKRSPISSTIPSNIKDLGSRIVQNSDHLQSIIDAILNFAQLESGQFIYETEQFLLQTMIDNLQSVITFQEQNSNNKFVFNYPSNSVTLKTNSLIIQQVLANLIINAFKYCKNGNITLEIKAENDHLLIIIGDTGIGLTDDEIESIFIPFYQSSRGNKRKYGGTGLGLALVKRFIDELNGSIHVTSKKDTFTKFSIDIPNIVV